MAASGYGTVVVFAVIFIVCGKSDSVQVSFNAVEKQIDRSSALNLPVDIADTAKKKTTLNLDNPFVRSNYNEIPSKTVFSRNGLFHISKQRVIRSRRDAMEVTNKVRKGQVSEVQSTKSTIVVTTPSVISSIAKTSNSGNKSLVSNKPRQPAVGINGSTTKIVVRNSTTVKPDCVNRTEAAQLEVINKVSPEDSMWAAISLSILLFILFTVVWYSKMWRKNSDFYEKYGTGKDAPDTSTEMAWSKYGHTTTVSIQEIIQSKKQFFQELQMKIKAKLKNNNEHKGSGSKHTARYSKLLTLPNDIDEEGSDEEDVLYKRL